MWDRPADRRRDNRGQSRHRHPDEPDEVAGTLLIEAIEPIDHLEAAVDPLLERFEALSRLMNLGVLGPSRPSCPSRPSRPYIPIASGPATDPCLRGAVDASARLTPAGRSACLSRG